jgi:hypothetical protein
MSVTPKSSRLHVLAVSGLAATTALAALAASPRPSQSASPTANLQASQNYGKLPLSFEDNHGQIDSSAKFVSHGKGYSLFLTDGAAILALTKNANASSALEREPRDRRPVTGHDFSRADNAHKINGDLVPAPTDTIQMQLAGANPAARVEGQDQLPGVANYFLGNDPAKWRTNVPTYAKVHYTGVYNGIDLVYYGNQSQLEYDFVVAPNADPKPIRLQFAGARKLALTREGDLEVTGKNGEIAFHKPVLYQETNGQRQPVEGQFTLQANNTVSFKIGRYDHAKSLVIDPVLTYSTYLGGSNGGDHGDAAWAIAVDGSGSAYITGQAFSTNFPVTAGSYEPKDGAAAIGESNAFVTKLNAAGTALVYSTYLGGTSDNASDVGFGIAVDSSGNAYIVGQAYSSDFPTTKGAFQTATAGRLNAFVTKLNPAGSALVYSTYLGGAYYDIAYAVAVDASGDAYVTGQATSIDFPVKGAYQAANNHPYGGNEFVTKFNPTGSALIYSTYIGGSNGNLGDSGTAIAIDAAGDAYVVGGSQDTDFPTTIGSAYQAALIGQENAVVTKLNPAGSKLIYSTYIGGSGADSAAGVAVDSSGNAYITGQTTSQNYPVTEGAFQSKFGYTTDGGSNAFVTKLNPAGTALVYSTYLGGNGEGDQANAIALDKLGDVYITGQTDATNFPLTAGAIQTTNDAYGGSAFVTKLNPTGTELLYSTYLSGSGSQGNGGDSGNGIALNPTTQDAYVAGRAYSANFPVTTGAFQPTNKGSATGTSNAFVSHLAIGGETTTTVAAKANPEQQGSNAILTAKVSANYGSVVPTGSVSFAVDGGAATTVALNSVGQAPWSSATLALGKHTVVITYSGSTAYLTSAATYVETISIGTPILSPATGTYELPQSVTITDATPGATIYYTTNGTAPSASSTKYTAAFQVATVGTTTIQAIAVLTGYPNSAVAIAKYTIAPGTPTPTITPAGGTKLTEAQLVTIANSSKSPAATIYYTTNGATPTSASTKYTAPFLVAANETVKSVAIATGDSPSTVATAAFTFIGAPTLLAGPATAITTSSATLNAFTSTQSLAGTYYFQYGASATTLTSTTAKTALNTLPTVQVSKALTGLKTKTIYYYQFVVTTPAGSVLGPVLSFTTN